MARAGIYLRTPIAPIGAQHHCMRIYSRAARRLVQLRWPAPDQKASDASALQYHAFASDVFTNTS